MLGCPLDTARTVADEDPLARTSAVRPRLVPWSLVGVNPEAIDETLIIRPGDIA